MAATSAADSKDMTSAKLKKEEKMVTSTSSHPTFAVMVLEAVTKMADKGGCSLHAIKKYIGEVHKVDMDRKSSSNVVKKVIKRLVDAGQLSHPKGTGATGSFKLAVAGAASSKTSKKTAAAIPAERKKPERPSKPKKAVATKMKKTSAAKPPSKREPVAAASSPTSKEVKPKKAKKSSQHPKEPKIKLPKTLKKTAVAPVVKSNRKPAPKKK